MNLVERLRVVNPFPDSLAVRNEAADEIERLHQVCRNVYEVWAGSDGLRSPLTCDEDYLMKLIEQMRDEAKKGLK